MQHTLQFRIFAGTLYVYKVPDKINKSNRQILLNEIKMKCSKKLNPITTVFINDNNINLELIKPDYLLYVEKLIIPNSLPTEQLKYLVCPALKELIFTFDKHINLSSNDVSNRKKIMRKTKLSSISKICKTSLITPSTINLSKYTNYSATFYI